jgi:hypothetical protein
VARTLHPLKQGTPALPAKKTKPMGRWKENMDAKKLAALMIAALLAVPVITASPPGMLVLIDAGLVALLYFVRSRRSVVRASR